MLAQETKVVFFFIACEVVQADLCNYFSYSLL